jgi:hypothetical protein
LPQRVLAIPPTLEGALAVLVTQEGVLAILAIREGVLAILATLEWALMILVTLERALTILATLERGLTILITLEMRGDADAGGEAGVIPNSPSCRSAIYPAVIKRRRWSRCRVRRGGMASHEGTPDETLAGGGAGAR